MVHCMMLKKDLKKKTLRENVENPRFSWCWLEQLCKIPTSHLSANSAEVINRHSTSYSSDIGTSSDHTEISPMCWILLHILQLFLRCWGRNKFSPRWEVLSWKKKLIDHYLKLSEIKFWMATFQKWSKDWSDSYFKKVSLNFTILSLTLKILIVKY